MRHPRSASRAALHIGPSCVAMLLGGLIAPPALQAAPKTDVVVFGNGDHLTGEIKGLEKGKLELSTDSAGTVHIEWDKVSSIQTNQYLEVESSGGQRQFGRAPNPGTRGSLSLQDSGAHESAAVPLADIVRIVPIEQGSLVSRLDGYLTVGFSYAKANNQTQFNLSGGLSSRDEVREWALDGQTTLNSQSDGRTTSMYDVTLSNRRFLERRWFLQSFGSVQGNEELGLNIREIVGGGGGRYLAQSLHQEWSAFAALAYAHENFEGESARNSLESVLGTQYSFFQYDSPKRSLDVGLAVFPSLTESGRVRAEADIDARIEIVSDLFFDLSIYGSYDSDPAASAPSNSDYGVVTSLGYSF